MKNYLRWIIPVVKLGLLLVFLFNIGFFSLFNHINNDVQPPSKKDGGRSDVQYLNEKVKRANLLGDNYGPEEYFADLTEIKLKQKKNDFDRMAVLSVQNSIGQMLDVFNRNVKRQRAICSDSEYANYMSRLNDARDKLEKITDPINFQARLDQRKETERPGYWSGVLSSVLLWLLNFWWHKMPFGLVLLLIWHYQEQKTFRINNPLSFLLCLTLYPIVIIRTWQKILRVEGREMVMKVELRRRTFSIFSLISENELLDINRFAKSNFTISEYRRYLDNRGLIRRQALLPVLATVIILFLIPRNTSGNYAYNQNHGTCEYQVTVKAPPGSFDNTGQVQPTVFVEATIPENNNLVYCPTMIGKIFLPPCKKEKKGFYSNPDPIPLFA
ncbi:MAG: hypothetical protein ACOYMB_03115 [Patescibacteria group bacterium]